MEQRCVTQVKQYVGCSDYNSGFPQCSQAFKVWVTSPYDSNVFLNNGDPVLEWSSITYNYYSDLEDCDIRNFRAVRSAYDTVYLDPELPTMVSTGAFIHDNPCDLQPVYYLTFVAIASEQSALPFDESWLGLYEFPWAAHASFDSSTFTLQIEKAQTIADPWFAIYITAEVKECSTGDVYRATTPPIVINASIDAEPPQPVVDTTSNDLSESEISSESDQSASSVDSIFDDLINNFSIGTDSEIILYLGLVKDSLPDAVFLQELSVSDESFFESLVDKPSLTDDLRGERI